MNVATGAALAVIAGAVNGLFALPMKVNRGWEWENSWLPFSLLSMALFPWLIAFRTTPELRVAYSQVNGEYLGIAVLWGAIVYGGSLLFGVSLGYIGTALAFALLVGFMSIVGVLLPIILFSPEVLHSEGGRWILGGIVCLLISLVVSMVAGKLKEKAQGGENTSGIGDQTRKSAWVGMVLAGLGGALSGLLSLGMNMQWATSIRAAAVQFGSAQPSHATNAVLALVLLGGAIPNMGYCTYLLLKRNTLARYGQADSGRFWLMVGLMSVMYSGSVALWGVAISESMLGPLGPSVGWALFIGTIVISSNIGGFGTGEWRNAGRRAIGLMAVGLSLVIFAMVLIGYGNSLSSQISGN
ncbi:MAG: L-rhamnose/proton symporter RhaT [Acidobacteriota bacterium]